MKWEYAVRFIRCDWTYPETSVVAGARPTDIINEMAKEGWRLVAFEPHNNQYDIFVAVFGREENVHGGQ